MSRLIHPNIGITRAQAESIINSTASRNIWEGAIRSGKTFATQLRWLIFLADNPPKGGELLMVGRTRDSLARNVIAPMMNEHIFGRFAKEVHYTTGSSYANILGHRIHVMGAHDKKAENVIRGMTLAGALVDEITVLPEEFFHQLLGRLSVPGAQLFGTTNPDSPQHWFMKKYLKRIDDPLKPLEGWARFHFEMDDNPSLEEDYKNKIKSEFTGLFYKRFILGQWVAAEGAVYDMWDEKTHIVKTQDMPTIKEYLGVGIDYGTTNPTSAIMIGIGTDNVLYAVDEWRYKPNSLAIRKTDAELSKGIREWVKEKFPQVAEKIPYIVDPAAASFKVQLFKDGAYVAAADNNVSYGIKTISSLLGKQKLKVCETCTGLIEEIPGYVWDQKATDKGKDEVVKENDHSLDAFRYGVVTTENLWRYDIQ